jgi:hypothetical protein
MSEPVIVAVPPKGGSLDDVMERLVNIGLVDQDLVACMRRLIKADKKRIKIEEKLIRLADQHGVEADLVQHLSADQQDFGQELLAGMRRWQDDAGVTRLTFTPKAGVDAMLHTWRQDADPVIREAAMSLHLELDLGRYGRPTRMMFDHLEVESTLDGELVRAVLVGTEHEVTPTYLRKHKRDLSLTCYDAFHNTLLDALDTPKVRNWQELSEHLIEANTDVRILGSFGVQDYLGHFILLPEAMATDYQAEVTNGRWDRPGAPMDLLRAQPALIDAQYEGSYRQLLAAEIHQLDFEHTTQDIEEMCVQDNRSACYIVRSGGTIVRTPGLYVAGEPLLVSETIVAVNHERMEHNRSCSALVEAIQPETEDHSHLWRDALRARLGDRWLVAGA